MPRKTKSAAPPAEPQSAPKKRSLLDDDDEEEGAPVLRVNEDFARRFQHNKEREELHRLQAKHGAALASRLAGRGGRPSGGDSDVDEEEDGSESESESEEGQLDLESALDDRFLETLLKIRRRDPSIYEPGAKLLADDDDEEEGEDEDRPAKSKPAGKAKKPVYLREVQAQQLLQRAAEGGDPSDSSDEEPDDARAADLGPTYVEEQEAVRRAFLEAVDGEEAEEEGDALLVRSKSNRAVPLPTDMSRAKLVSTIFEVPAPDEDAHADAFLKDFLLNKRWVPAGEEDSDGEAGGAGGDSADELERVEQFEAQYNFRFEEPGGATLVAQPRRPEGLIRKPDTARAERRKAKAERASAEKERLREELKRLKNLKKKEIEQKMKAIARVAGAAGPPIGADVLDEEEWDPERHEAMMQGAFGVTYYQQSDEDETELKKPQFEDMEEELQELLAGQVAGERGFAEAAHRAEARAQQLVGDDEEEEEGDDDDDEAADEEEGGDGAGNRFSKRAMKKWRRALEAKLEEYYRLDCEDFVAGLPCRFKYRAVAPDKFGLRTEELLLLTDKELNQVVSLKKLAPYREADPKPKYGDKRQRAEAALSRLAQRSQGGGGGSKRLAAGAADEEENPTAVAASRLASFTAPTKKARREAMQQRAAAPKLTKNAAKRLRKKRAKEGKQQARDDIAL